MYVSLEKNCRGIQKQRTESCIMSDAVGSRANGPEPIRATRQSHIQATIEYQKQEHSI